MVERWEPHDDKAISKLGLFYKKRRKENHEWEKAILCENDSDE